MGKGRGFASSVAWLVCGMLGVAFFLSPRPVPLGEAPQNVALRWSLRLGLHEYTWMAIVIHGYYYGGKHTRKCLKHKKYSRSKNGSPFRSVLVGDRHSPSQIHT